MLNNKFIIYLKKGVSSFIFFNELIKIKKMKEDSFIFLKINNLNKIKKMKIKKISKYLYFDIFGYNYDIGEILNETELDIKFEYNPIKYPHKYKINIHLKLNSKWIIINENEFKNDYKINNEYIVNNLNKLKFNNSLLNKLYKKEKNKILKNKIFIFTCGVTCSGKSTLLNNINKNLPYLSSDDIHQRTPFKNKDLSIKHDNCSWFIYHKFNYFINNGWSLKLEILGDKLYDKEYNFIKKLKKNKEK